MWIKRPDRAALQGDDIAHSEITPQRVYQSRRRVLQAIGAASGRQSDWRERRGAR